MATFELQISAEQQNLMRLEPAGGVNSRNFCYFFKLRCYACNEISKEVTMHIGDQAMRYKCKACKKEGGVKLLPNHGQPVIFGNQRRAPFTPLVRFYVTEFEPVEYCFNGGWTGVAANGNEVELNLLNTPFQTGAGGVSVLVENPTYRFRIIHN